VFESISEKKLDGEVDRNGGDLGKGGEGKNNDGGKNRERERCEGEGNRVDDFNEFVEIGVGNSDAEKSQ
jgi:hypothetical protein